MMGFLVVSSESGIVPHGWNAPAQRRWRCVHGVPHAVNRSA
jgi:hypothetical protein